MLSIITAFLLLFLFFCENQIPFLWLPLPLQIVLKYGGAVVASSTATWRMVYCWPSSRVKSQTRQKFQSAV